MRASFEAMIEDSLTECHVEKMNSGWTVMDFTYRKESYPAKLLGNGREMNKVLRRYIEETKSEEFGRVDEDDQLHVTLDNKKAFALKIARDFTDCLNALIVSQGRHLLDYAVYFRELKVAETYSNFVQQVVCNFIVHQNFLSGSAKFTVVNWKTLLNINI